MTTTSVLSAVFPPKAGATSLSFIGGHVKLWDVIVESINEEPMQLVQHHPTMALLEQLFDLLLVVVQLSAQLLHSLQPRQRQAVARVH